MSVFQQAMCHATSDDLRFTEHFGENDRKVSIRKVCRKHPVLTSITELAHLVIKQLFYITLNLMAVTQSVGTRWLGSYV